MNKTAQRCSAIADLARMAMIGQQPDVCSIDCAIVEAAIEMWHLGMVIYPERVREVFGTTTIAVNQQITPNGTCCFGTKKICIGSQYNRDYPAIVRTVAHELCHLLDAEDMLWNTEYQPKAEGEDDYWDDPTEKRARRVGEHFRYLVHCAGFTGKKERVKK